MNFTLVYDLDDQNAVDKLIKPLAGEFIDNYLTLEQWQANWSIEQKVLFFLPDIVLKDIIGKIAQTGLVFSILPHKNAPSFIRMMGVEQNLKNAMTYLQDQSEENIESLDVVFCNEIPLLHDLVIGDTFQFINQTSSSFVTFKKFFKSLTKLHHFRVDLQLKNDQIIKTAIIGAMIVPHSRKHLLSRVILNDSFQHEPNFHAFLVSPRSIIQLLFYFFKSLLFKRFYPEIGAHIKTGSFIIKSVNDRDLVYLQDGIERKAKELVLETRLNHFNVITGKDHKSFNKLENPSEIFQIKSLPKNDSAQEISNVDLPLINKASTEEFKELFQILRENAEIKISYLVLMILSVALAVFGLFSNSTAVVIGAMILAPLMAPIISLSMATLRQDKKLILQSLNCIFVGMLIAFIFAFVLTKLTPISVFNDEIIARTRPTLLDLGVAVVAGVAGAYGYAREEVNKTLAGVAIAVALIPPLAVSAIGASWGNFDIFWGASLLLLTNLAGITLAGALTFLILGFSPFKLATRGVLISLITVITLSIPLGIGFNQMVYEHKLVRKLDGLVSGYTKIVHSRVISFKPLKIGIKVATASSLVESDYDAIKEKVYGTIKKPAKLEITTAITR